MIIRKAQPSDAASISLLMNEGFGWENNKPISSTFFNRDHIFCMLSLFPGNSMEMSQKLPGNVQEASRKPPGQVW